MRSTYRFLYTDKGGARPPRANGRRSSARANGRSAVERANERTGVSPLAGLGVRHRGPMIQKPIERNETGKYFSLPKYSVTTTDFYHVSKNIPRNRIFTHTRMLPWNMLLVQRTIHAFVDPSFARALDRRPSLRGGRAPPSSTVDRSLVADLRRLRRSPAV